MPLNAAYGTILPQDAQRDISDSMNGFTLGYSERCSEIEDAFDKLYATGLTNFSNGDEYKLLFSGFEVAGKSFLL